MKTRIAFVLQPFDHVNPPKDNTSLQIWTYEVASRLAQSHDVMVYVRPGGNRFGKSDKLVDGVLYRYAPAAFDRWLNKLHGFFLNARRLFFRRLNARRPRFASLLYHLGYSLYIAYDSRKQRREVIHIFNFSQFVPVIRALNPSVNIVLHMQCDWLIQLDSSMVERRLRKVDLIVGCSDYITERICEAFPAYADRCKTVYNGVDLDHFYMEPTPRTSKRNGELRLLFVGRVSPEKGVHVLLDAFRRVVMVYPQARLDIIGGNVSAPREFIVALSDDPKVSGLERFYTRGYTAYLEDKLNGDWVSNAKFLGSIPNSQLVEHFSQADVFVFPSVWEEPFGMPPVEAMAAGVPVVATRVGGITETIEDGITGLLVEPDEAQALAGAICRLLEDEALRKRMGQAGRQRVETLFAWDKVVGNLLHVYSSVLVRRRE